ncbi:MAG: TIGR03790 family protein [Pseudomonadota bacterium]
MGEREMQWYLVLILILLPVEVSCALTPEGVVVVCNKMAWHSCDLAGYYMKKRGIPVGNLVELKAPSGEYCSREEYDKYIASPVRAFLNKTDPKREKSHCLVMMYGVPLRINSSGDPKTSQGAAVDSELALVREEHYSLDRWLPNKYFIGYRGKKTEAMPQNVVMVSRLDGPSEVIVRRIIDDSMEIENQGLNGRAYFDARWPDPGDKELSGYAFYDRAIHNSARVVKKKQTNAGCR